ncbi:MAG: uroporphyrinogen-III C-methyltransferase [Planctomycetaceae bacterium]
MRTGKVYLVGAGPGDPGLLTVRGRELLQQADLVLYDGLANPLLLSLTGGRCERTARTRVGGDSIVPQRAINERLIQEAQAGNTVVRLKGGDPYIFGRGSEEVAALQAAGVPFEVIPGITAATAAAEYAGFSFTHRDHASAVAFITGHEDPTRPVSHLDFTVLAAFPGTLVFYMGLGRIATICDELIKHGKAPETPAAVVCHASLPSQRVLTSTLTELPAAAASAGLKPPSLIVVGECVTLRNGESWFEQRALFGKRIGVTRPIDQCDEVAQQIIQLSGQPVLMPLIEIHPVGADLHPQINAALTALKDFHWLIFTSVNGIHEFFRHLERCGLDVRALGHLKLGAIGSATAMALRQRGLNADVVPEVFRAETLADCLKPHVAGQRILWARASRGRDVLPAMLTAVGADDGTGRLSE